MECSYKEAVIWFAENPTTMEPSDFFGMFSKFIANWKVSANYIWSVVFECESSLFINICGPHKNTSFMIMYHNLCR